MPRWFYVLLGLLAGAAAGIPAGGALLPDGGSDDQPPPRISVQATQAQVRARFNLGTLPGGRYAYTSAESGVDAEMYVYDGGRQPNRWRVVLVLEQKPRKRPAGQGVVPAS